MCAKSAPMKVVSRFLPIDNARDTQVRVCPGAKALARRTLGLAQLLAGRVFSNLWRIGIPNIGAIMMFHEIQDDVIGQLRTGCSPKYLEHLIKYVRSRGAAIVSIDDAIGLLAKRSQKKFIVLTFDDGYRDTLSRALPCLEKLNAPFCVYVPTQALTRTMDAWWLALRQIFKAHDTVEIEAMNRRFECSTLDSKSTALREVCNWIATDFRLKTDLQPTFAKYRISMSEIVNRYFLSVAELRALAKSPLVTIGGHGSSHEALANLPSAAVYDELTQSRDFLEQVVDRAVNHLAYPYGTPLACGPREFTMARQLGFLSAATTESRPFYYYCDPVRLHALPRMDYSADFWTGAGAADCDESSPSLYADVIEPDHNLR